MIKQLNEIINLLESINGTECDVEVDLDGSLTFVITKTKIKEARTSEDAQLHGNVKLPAMDELHEFLKKSSGIV